MAEAVAEDLTSVPIMKGMITITAVQAEDTFPGLTAIIVTTTLTTAIIQTGNAFHAKDQNNK